MFDLTRKDWTLAAYLSALLVEVTVATVMYAKAFGIEDTFTILRAFGVTGGLVILGIAWAVVARRGVAAYVYSLLLPFSVPLGVLTGHYVTSLY